MKNTYYQDALTESLAEIWDAVKFTLSLFAIGIFAVLLFAYLAFGAEGIAFLRDLVFGG